MMIERFVDHANYDAIFVYGGESKRTRRLRETGRRADVDQTGNMPLPI